MFKVSSCFVADFKVGDNINYNLDTLRLLYELCNEDAGRQRLLRKPIIVILVSVTEAILHDFIKRVQSTEHVTTLEKKTVAVIQGKNYSKLTNLVSGAKALDLFKADKQFYDDLDELRRLRNRVHIQNEERHLERHDAKAFTAARHLAAESALEYIAKFLADEHPRKSSTHGFVRDFEFPWEPHWN